MEELEGVGGYLGRCSARREAAGDELSAAAVVVAAVAGGDVVVPGSLGGGERAGKLREEVGRRFPGLFWIEGGWTRVPHGELRVAATMACGGASGRTGASSIRLENGKGVEREVGNVCCASKRERIGAKAQVGRFGTSSPWRFEQTSLAVLAGGSARGRPAVDAGARRETERREERRW